MIAETLAIVYYHQSPITAILPIKIWANKAGSRIFVIWSLDLETIDTAMKVKRLKT